MEEFITVTKKKISARAIFKKSLGCIQCEMIIRIVLFIRTKEGAAKMACTLNIWELFVQ